MNISSNVTEGASGCKEWVRWVYHTPSTSPNSPKWCTQWDQRLVTLDPVALNHITRNPNIYEKPWQTRRFVNSLVGCGLLSAEGIVHKRQRRVASPAFSIQNLKAFSPIVFEEGSKLVKRWRNIIGESGGNGLELDIYLWISRVTFDVIGTVGVCTVLPPRVI